jgi:hypothetical protein
MAVSMPQAMQRDAGILAEWVTRSYEFARSLPLKEPKKRAKKKA